MSPDRFNYRIQPTPQGWAWSTLDLKGRTVEHGLAPSKAVAAACVVRAIARVIAPSAAMATADRKAA